MGAKYSELPSNKFKYTMILSDIKRQTLGLLLSGIVLYIKLYKITVFLMKNRDSNSIFVNYSESTYIYIFFREFLKSKSREKNLLVNYLKT